jgi:hypothetical protein
MADPENIHARKTSEQRLEELKELQRQAAISPLPQAETPEATAKAQSPSVLVYTPEID